MALRLAGSDLSGKLIAIGRAVDAASQTVLLRAGQHRQGRRNTDARPGGRGRTACGHPGSAGSSQRLPTSALIRHDGQTFVSCRLPATPRAAASRPPATPHQPGR